MWWNFLRTILFQFDPESAHHFGARVLQLFGWVTKGKMPLALHSPRKRSYQLGEFPLHSPLGLAAGFDKDGKLARGISALGFGFTEVGTVTPLPQPGNPSPRLFRLPHSRALINRFGFNSEGAVRVAERLRALRAEGGLPIPMGINLGKNKVTPMDRAAEDYVAAMEQLYAVADYLVVNISSPNTPGLTSLQEGDSLPGLLRSVRECRDRLAKQASGSPRPLFLKLSPDLTDPAMKEAVEQAMNAGFLGIIATNTSRRRELPGISALDLGMLGEEGGLSGAPLRAEALERIKKLRSWMPREACLISAGGLGGADDAEARLEAGANLLQVYTEFVYSGPGYPLDLAKKL